MRLVGTLGNYCFIKNKKLGEDLKLAHMRNCGRNLGIALSLHVRLDYP